MHKDIYLQLFDAIKQDDLALFSSCFEGNENISYGRFPLLSLMYLYDAKKLYNAYFDVLCKVEEFRFIPEYFEISRKFRKSVGKTIRLYTNASLIFPIEMLGLLNKDIYLKRNYNKLAHNENIENNIKKIYAMRSQKIIITSSTIKISGSPLTSKDIKKINLSMAFSAICIVVLVGVYALIGGVCGLGISIAPTKISNISQLQSALNSSKSYVMVSDICAGSVDMGNCFEGDLDGNGHTLFFDSLPSSAILNKNGGCIRDLNIVYKDNIESTLGSTLSLFVNENSGEIINVNVVCKGLKITINKGISNELHISGIASKNNGKIAGCGVTLDGDFASSGSVEGCVAGIVGINNGTIESCKTNEGTVSTTEMDISGIANFNEANGVINNCVNNCQLIQNSAEDSWSPNIGGITMTNYGSISNSYNYAELSIKSDYVGESGGIAFIGGISSNNYGNITQCLSNGNIEVSSKKINIYAGGISAINQSVNSNSQVITATLSKCGSNGNINLNIDDENGFMIAGGICGFVYSGKISDNYSLSSYSTGYVENKYSIGGAIGAFYVNYYLIGYSISCEISNNFVLDGNNLDGTVGGYLVLASNSLAFVDLKDAFDTIKEEFTMVATAEELKVKEVYWNE